MRLLSILLIMILISGCQTVPKASDESSQEAKGALNAIVGSMAGQEMSQEDMKSLQQQIQTDEEARSAVESITGSMIGATPSVKYCPVDGKRYAYHLKHCPEHTEIQLKEIEP